MLKVLQKGFPKRERVSAGPPVGLMAVLAIGAIVVGALAVYVGPTLIVLTIAAGAAILAIPAVASFKGRIFWISLATILLGYMMAGKGFAYWGVHPIYVSELALATGCFIIVFLALATGRLKLSVLARADAIALLLFMFWGAVRTIPFLAEYGLDALRDGVIWGYAAFAFLVAMLVPQRALERLLGLYNSILPYWLLWLLATIWLSRSVTLPNVPGTAVPIILLKAGDVGVHLAGAAAFLLLRLDRYYGARFSRAGLWVLWMLWGLNWIVFGSTSRGGMLSAVVGIMVVLLLRPNRTGWMRPAVLVAILLTGLLMLELSGVQLTSDAARRPISTEQIITGFTSTFGGPGRGDQLANRNWRLGWWRDIAGYTFGGDYLWSGKGYGVNLAIDDGRPGIVGPDGTSNRHPHNITMNILARSGVIGLALWLLFLLSLGMRLLARVLRKGYDGEQALWFLAYWLAFLFNAQFDVFLEGPMGGVWFWSLVGMIWVHLGRGRFAARTGREPKEQALAT